jgi:molecular chaperone GrpE
VPENTVVQELQRGYRLHDRLLRPARVVVSKRAGEEQEATPDSKAEKKPQREP